jgi:hypothetical protein
MFPPGIWKRLNTLLIGFASPGNAKFEIPGQIRLGQPGDGDGFAHDHLTLLVGRDRFVKLCQRAV